MEKDNSPYMVLHISESERIRIKCMGSFGGFLEEYEANPNRACSIVNKLITDTTAKYPESHTIMYLLGLLIGARYRENGMALTQMVDILRLEYPQLLEKPLKSYIGPNRVHAR